MGVVEEESDESFAWLELLTESGLGDTETGNALKREAYEITAIAIASIKTARKKK
jgi:hypothetical protein